MKEQREIHAGDTCVACGRRRYVRYTTRDPWSHSTANVAGVDLCCDSELGPQVAAEAAEGD